MDGKTFQFSVKKTNWKENPSIVKLLSWKTFPSKKAYFWLGRFSFQCLTVFACGALAASISVGIVIPSTWFAYLYKILLALRSWLWEQNCSTTRQFTDSKLRQGSYGNRKAEVQDFSRTIPGLFYFSRTRYLPNSV